MHFLQSFVRALSAPFRLRTIIRDRINQIVLQNNQIIGRLERLSHRLDRLTNPAQALLDQYEGLVTGKLELIDYAFDRWPIHSFADLGGAYAYPRGGYSLYTVDKYKVPNGYLVDSDTPEGLIEEVRKRPGLRFIRGNLILPETSGQIGHVDVAYVFDVLCMQGPPGWQALLACYADRVNCFLITSAQFDCFPCSVRLMDLSEKDYYECVPRDYAADAQKVNLFAIRDEIHPAYGCKHRDAPQYWQWAITDDDLIGTMRDLGFRLAYLRPLFKMENIPRTGVETRGFVFVRK